jgi:hypothetical protein
MPLSQVRKKKKKKNIHDHSFLTFYFILDTSSMVHMKFHTISYPEMVQDAILTAQFVQSLPVMISKSLSISVDDVIVVTITSGTTQKRDSGGVVVNLAIPSDDVADLQTLVSQTNSSLYSPSNGQLASLIDSSYAISNSGMYWFFFFFFVV